MRHNPSTVVVLAGRPSEQVLAAVGRSLNVVVIRPEDRAGTEGGIEAAAAALRRAGGVSAAYVVVAADPLAGVAGAWEAMWSLTAESHGSGEFELRAAEALGAWRARRFELPDYYLVLAEETVPGRDRADAAAEGAVPGTGGAYRVDGHTGPTAHHARARRPARASRVPTSTSGRCAPSGRTG